MSNLKTLNFIYACNENNKYSFFVFIYRKIIIKYKLISVVFKQLGHVIADCLRRVWDKNDWLHKGQHGFRLGYSCESQSSLCART